ncbi:MAG: ScyD/ScyE family protein [Aquabacterium sp.]
MKSSCISVLTRRPAMAVLVAALAAALPGASWAHAGPHGGVDTSPEPTGPSPFTVLAEGLSNPRGIAIDESSGSPVVYVTEAGRGGTGGVCLTSPNGDYDDCYGATGAIARVSGGQVVRVIRNLPSIAGPNGGFAVGPSRIKLLGRSVVFTVANYGSPEERGLLASADKRFGHVLWYSLIQPSASYDIANLSAFEDGHNPDGGELESNPSGLAFSRFGLIATDAGANDVLSVRPDGTVSLRYAIAERHYPAPDFLGLPPGTMMPVQSVPTVVVAGPDGAHYVGEFTGFPYPKGSARVFRVPAQGEPTVYAQDFSNIIDMAFGPDGSLYVLEMAQNGLTSGDVTGSVIRLSPSGERTKVASTGLAYPTAIAVDRQGRIYVTNYGTHGTKAQLVRF